MRALRLLALPVLLVLAYAAREIRARRLYPRVPGRITPDGARRNGWL